MGRYTDDDECVTVTTTPAAMNILLLTTAFMFTASAIPHNEWTLYKAEYNKVYTSEGEDVRRFQQYLKTKGEVEEHNRKYDRGETTYTKGINKFSDWFPEEIKAILPTMPKIVSSGKPFHLPPGTQIPDSINWVDKGAVTGVKNQGDCYGSGYAFSAVGALEGLMFTTNNTKTDLSAQELVDCSVGDGCDAGLPQLCFDYVYHRNGIDTNVSYPYEAKQGSCRADKGEIGATCDGFVEVRNETELTAAVGTKGPVSIFFGVSDDFFSYKRGIFDGTCSVAGPNHAMLAVGYDTDEATKKPYWLIKNSWGTDWGEKGYARVIRNQDIFWVGDHASYPTFKK